MITTPQYAEIVLEFTSDMEEDFVMIGKIESIRIESERTGQHHYELPGTQWQEYHILFSIEIKRDLQGYDGK